MPHFLGHTPHASIVFKDAASPQILLAYATSERLGILKFKVANLVAHSHIDTLSVPTSPTPGGLRKANKCITFHDPMLDHDQSCSASLPQGQGTLMKTALNVSFSDPEKMTINGTQCKPLLTLHHNPYQPLNTIFPILQTPNLRQPSR